MIWAQSPAVVRAPATSANLGPGFDAFGLALACYDQVEARVTGGGLTLVVRGEGDQTADLGERHLVVTAMRAAFAAMGGQPDGLALGCVNAIPHGRGLGSSAAAVVSGILAARALAADGAARLPDAEVLRLAVDLEGHPDNVAACLAGGLTIAWRPGEAGGEAPDSRAAGEGPGSGAAGEGPGSGAGVAPGAHGIPRSGRGPVGLLRLDVLATLATVMCVAPNAMATHEARCALPAVVPHADAAANAARSALLLAGLTSDPSVLFAAPPRVALRPSRGVPTGRCGSKCGAQPAAARRAHQRPVGAVRRHRGFPPSALPRRGDAGDRRTPRQAAPGRDRGGGLRGRPERARPRPRGCQAGPGGGRFNRP